MTGLLDEDTLRHLARPDDALRAPSRPLSDVRRRAHRLALNRRTGIGLAGAVAGLAAAGAVVVLPDLPGEPGRAVIPATAASTTDGPVGCGAGYGTPLSYADVPDLLYLPSTEAAGPVEGQVRPLEIRFTCLPERVDAVATERTEGTVTAALTAYGPGAVTVDSRFETLPGRGWTRSTVTVAGRSFVVASIGGARPELRASWTEPDGSTWRVELVGLDLTTAQALLADLRVADGRLDLDTLPAGVLPERTALTDAQQPRRVERGVSVPFGAPEDAPGGKDSWGLSVWDKHTLVIADAMVGSRRIPWGDGSDRYLVSGDNGGPRSPLFQWSGNDGTTFRIYGDITLDEALKVARSVRKVTLDDPRLVAASPTPDPTST